MGGMSLGGQLKEVFWKKTIIGKEETAVYFSPEEGSQTCRYEVSGYIFCVSGSVF